MLSKYKLFLHESLNEPTLETGVIFHTLKQICEILGGKLVENIRLSDICIINKLDKEYFPPGIKLLNQEFLIDAFSHLKHPDFSNKKYIPTAAAKKKK